MLKDIDGSNGKSVDLRALEKVLVIAMDILFLLDFF